MSAATIIGIISAILSIAKFFVETAQQNKWIDAGSAQATLKGMQDANDALTRAQKARELVRADIAADPSSVRKPDPFERTGE